MKPISLELSAVGLLGTKSFDFTTKAEGLALATGTPNEVKEAFFLALFGAGDSGKLTFTFSDAGEVYTVIRDFSEEKASVQKNGMAVVEGIPQTNAFLTKFTGICKDAYSALFVIDRDEAVTTFSGDETAKNALIDKLFSIFSPGRDDVNEVKASVKEKFDKLTVKLELVDPVDQSEVLALKTDAEETAKEKTALESDIDALTDAKNKGIAAQADILALQKATAERDKLLSQKAGIEKLRTRCQSSGKADALNSMVKNREKLLAEKSSLDNRLKELAAQMEKSKLNLVNGEKAKTKMENELVHCMARIEELRKRLYGIFEENTCSGLKSETEKLFASEEKEISLLATKKKTIEKEYEATRAAYEEILNKLKTLEISQQTRVAIRDGAVLEMTMAKLDEEIAEVQTSLNACNTRLAEIEPEAKQLSDGIKSAKASVKEIKKILVKGHKTKEEAINAAVIAKQSLYQSHIFVATQEKEIEAIGKKIAENERGLARYYEDTAALSSAEKGLEAYVSQVKEKLSTLEKEMLSLKAEMLFHKELSDVEYGEKCPVCRSIVLYKEETESAKTRQKYEKIAREYEKGSGVLAEYEDKRAQVANKMGELGARIKTSEAYINSLKSSIETRKDLIAKTLAQAGAKDSRELEDKLKDAISYSNSLTKLVAELAAAEGAVKAQEGSLGLLLEERKRLEEIELTRLNLRHNSLRAELNEVETGYKALAEFLGGKSAIEWLNELILIEKQEDTLNEEAAEKRAKLLSLLEEKEQINSVLVQLSERNRKITVDGKPLDYFEVVTQCLSKQVKELINEIKLSEKEVEDLKVELTAVRRVYQKAEDSKKETENELSEAQSAKDFCEKALAELEKELAQSLDALGINLGEVEAMLLGEAEKASALDKIKDFDSKLALVEGEIAKLEETLAGSKAYADNLEANSALLSENRQRYAETCAKAAQIQAKREELAERALLIKQLKEQHAAAGERLKTLTELSESVTDNGSFLKYIDKKAAKLAAFVSGGKYSLENGALVNTSTDKAIKAGEGTAEERLIYALSYAASLYESFADMLGGKPYLLFPLKDKENDKQCAKALVNYTSRHNLIVLADKGFASSLNKVLI